MIGTGTLINTGAIIVGGLTGHLPLGKAVHFLRYRCFS